VFVVFVTSGIAWVVAILGNMLYDLVAAAGAVRSFFDVSKLEGDYAAR
jgi:hypothetical protein